MHQRRKLHRLARAAKTDAALWKMMGEREREREIERWRGRES